MVRYRNYIKYELDIKRLKLEIAVVSAAVVFCVVSLAGFIPGLISCLKLRTPQYIRSIRSPELIDGAYVKIDYDCCFTSNSGYGSRCVTVRLSKKNEYLFALDWDDRLGYWYWKDYDYFENPFDSVDFKPSQPHSFVGRVEKDGLNLDVIRLIAFEEPETYAHEPVPNTLDNTLFDYYIVRMDPQHEEARMVGWFVLSLVGAVAVVCAVKWAINDQRVHMGFKRFEQRNAQAKQATEDYYNSRIRRGHRR